MCEPIGNGGSLPVELPVEGTGKMEAARYFTYCNSTQHHNPKYLNLNHH
jgi:hypothetical protein